MLPCPPDAGSLRIDANVLPGVGAVTGVPRLYRKQPDSSTFDRPRVLARVVLARVFVEPGLFGQTVHRYERLTGTDLDARELGFRIAAVGGFLVLELDASVLDRADQARRTPITMIFADLDQAIAASLATGSHIIDAPFAVPTGRGARLRHFDGLLVEYLEHRPSPYDVGTPAL